ncbi:aa3-type cytochrome c oxidase subunit IV [Sphingomonas sp.]
MDSDGIDRGSLETHVETYDGVIALLKWGAVVAAVVAALVIWLIAH